MNRRGRDNILIVVHDFGHLIRAVTARALPSGSYLRNGRKAHHQINALPFLVKAGADTRNAAVKQSSFGRDRSLEAHQASRVRAM